MLHAYSGIRINRGSRVTFHYETHPGNELAGSCLFDFCQIRARIFLEDLLLSHIT